MHKSPERHDPFEISRVGNTYTPAAAGGPHILNATDLAGSVAAIAERAGQEILEVYNSGDSSSVAKHDDSPLTLADTRAHEAILAALLKLTPGLPVLSEESAAIPFETRCAWSSYWLVDPLDGTKEFISRNGEFTVNIALIVDHQPILGVVHVPVTNVTFMGLPGSGAWRKDSIGALQPIKVQSECPTLVRVVGSKSHRGSSLDGFLQRLGPHQLLPVGSSLKFCMIAEGLADVYPRLGPTSEWDTAAAQAVLVGAGGEVLTVTGTPLLYNTKADILNPHFVVFADRRRPWLRYL